MRGLNLAFSILFFLPYLAVSAQSSLDVFIDSALHNNPSIVEYRNNIRISGNNRDIFLAGLKAQVGFSADMAYDPVVEGYGYDEVITNGQVVSTLVNFDKEILFTEQRKSWMDSYDVNAKQAGNKLRVSEAGLKRDITSQYLTAWGDLLQWKYNSDILESLRAEDSVLLALTRTNIYRQTDYFTFRASVKSQELAVSNALLQYRHSLMQLRYLAGIDDTTFVEITTPGLDRTPVPPRSESVFFRQFSLDSLRLKNQLQLIDITYQPSLSLHADAGYLSSLVLNPYKNFGAGIELKLSVPIYDGKQKELKYANIGLLEDNNRQRKSWFEKQYNLKQDRYNQMLTELKAQSIEITNQIDFYESLIDTEKRLISSGQVDISQYFLIIRNYIDVRNESAKNKVKQLMIINELNYLAN